MKEYDVHLTSNYREAISIIASHVKQNWRVHTFSVAENLNCTILFERDAVENPTELLQEGAPVNITRYGDLSDDRINRQPT